jgi:hypothetical protein
MRDKIVDGDSYAWEKRGGDHGRKGYTRYQHLLDGNAREIKIADYGSVDPVNFLTALRKVARDRGLAFRTKIVDVETVAFQVTGKRAVNPS